MCILLDLLQRADKLQKSMKTSCPKKKNRDDSIFVCVITYYNYFICIHVWFLYICRLLSVQ